MANGVLCYLKDCVNKLKADVQSILQRLNALESKPDLDEQILSLVGNTLSLTNGGSVDLTQYLDNEDDQILTVTTTLTDLVITIEDGNTVNVPLADLGSDDQMLSIVGNTITLEDGGSVTINHPDQEIVNGPFTGATARTGWWQGWSAIVTANLGTTVLIPWSREHQVITSPNDVTDFSFTYNVGNWYLRNRRNRVYVWIDYRLVVNGAVLYTRSNQVYRYIDERDEQNDTGNSNAIPVNLESWGSFSDDRLAIPANSTIEIETQVRWNVNGSQSDSWARLIGGLRSSVKWDFTPRDIVTGRL